MEGMEFAIINGVQAGVVSGIISTLEESLATLPDDGTEFARGQRSALKMEIQMLKALRQKLGEEFEEYIHESN
jgi:hypothetical protein